MALLNPADSMKSKTADAPVTSELPEARPMTRIIRRGRLSLTMYQLLSRTKRSPGVMDLRPS